MVPNEELAQRDGDRELRRRLTGEPTVLKLASSGARTAGRGHHLPAWRCPSAKASTTLGKLLTDSFRICPLRAMIRQRQGAQTLVMKATTRSAPCGASSRGVVGVSDMCTSSARVPLTPGQSAPVGGPGPRVSTALFEGKCLQDGTPQWACVGYLH